MLHVTPIESTARTWIDEKLVLGELPRRSSYYNKVCINPARWADVMQTVTPKDLEVLLEKSRDCGQMVSAYMHSFLKAFCCAMHGQSFEEDLKRVPWPILTSQSPKIVKIHFPYLSQAVGFLSQAVGLLSQALGQIWEAWIFHHPV